MKLTQDYPSVTECFVIDSHERDSLLNNIINLRQLKLSDKPWSYSGNFVKFYSTGTLITGAAYFHVQSQF